MIAPPRPPSHDQLDALIKEARDRQRRRRAKAAAIVAVAAAAATGIYSLAASGTSRPTAASGRGPRSAPGSCHSPSGWQLELGGLWSEQTGQHTVPFIVKRLGSTSCTLRGYPTILLAGSKGDVFAFRYSHRGDQMVTGRPPHAVRVGANGSAYFVLNKYRCDIGERAARFIRVGLPGVRSWLEMRLPRYPIIGYCPGEPPSMAIAVTPIVGSFRQASAHP